MSSVPSHPCATAPEWGPVGRSGAGGKPLQDGLIGIAAIHKEVERTLGAMGFGIQGLTKGGDLLGGQQREARQTCGSAILLDLCW